MLFLFLINNLKILFQSPIKLIHQRQRAERKLPKFVLYALLVIGLLRYLAVITLRSLIKWYYARYMICSVQLAWL